MEEVQKTYFLEGDVHWNAKGNHLIAESIKQPLQQMISTIEEQDKSE